MRICLIGTARRVINLANYLSAEGHEVHLISTSSKNIDELSKEVVIHRDFIGKISSRSLLKSIRIIPDFLRFFKRIKKIQPDLIHAFFVPWNGWFAALCNKHPFVLTTMGSDINPSTGAYKNILRKILTPYTMRKADVVTVVSSEGAQYVQKVLSNYQPVFYRAGFDGNYFYTSDKDEKLSLKYNVKDDDIVILSPRGLRPVYNNALIINAFKALIEKGHKNIKLLILGSKNDTEYPRYQAMVKDLEMEKEIVFVGKVPYQEMVHYYNLSDIVISVPLNDGFPATICEAYACAKPLIISNIPGTSEIFKHNINGFIVAPNDVSSLTNYLAKIIQDKLLRNRFSRMNLEQSNIFEFQKMHKVIVDIYKSVLNTAY